MRLIYTSIYLISSLLIISCNAQQTLDCAYTPKETIENKYPELTQYKNCGTLNNDQSITISKPHQQQIWYNEDKLAEIRIHDGIYYLHANGKIAKSIYFDNGADPFKEGLARTIRNHKIGFINKNLDIVIAPAYDFAFPFENGRSQVCNGCTKQKDGEHTAVVGGQWGYIDKTGKVIIAIKHNQSEINKL